VQYDAFGKVTSQSNATNQPHHGFAGRDIEPVGGLTYNRNRYYSTSSGRFISQDPIGFAAGDANLYRYVGNKPTMATDPSGLEEELIGWIYEISTPNGTNWAVQYVGKADDLEARWADPNHPAAHLLADDSNRIRVKPVYADPDPKATRQGTMRAALDQAQRAMEQKTMGNSLPPLNSIRAASEAKMEKWESDHSARTGRFRRHNRGGFIALPNRPSMTSLATLGKTAGTGLVIVGEVASMADAINAPYHIEDFGDYFGQPPSHFLYQELFANAYMMSWHDANQQRTERGQQPFIDAYLSAPESRSPILPIRPTSIGIMKEDLASRARGYIDAQLHYRVMTSGNDLLEYQYSQWSMDKKVEMYKKWVCPPK
jgi:RHS repeat-associated protein